MITPFNAIPSLPNGTKLAAIAGTITRIGKYSTGTNTHGDWSIQIVDMQDATGVAKILLKERPALPVTWQGHAVQFSGEKSIAIDDYQKDATKPIERRIKVTAGAAMDQVQGGHQAPQPGPPPQSYQQPAPGPAPQSYQQQPAPQTYQQPAPQPQAYQPPAPPPPHQPPPQTHAQSHTGHAPLFAGPTIGMAMNNACALLLAANDGNKDFAAYLNSRDFSVDLHTLTSDILRVTKHIENGHLASPAKDRAPAGPEHYSEKQW